MKQPSKSGIIPDESPALARHCLGYLTAGASLAVVSTGAMAWFGDGRVPKALGVSIALGFLLAGLSSAIGASIFYFGLEPESRKALPHWARSLARLGVALAAFTGLLVVALVIFAAGAIK